MCHLDHGLADTSDNKSISPMINKVSFIERSVRNKTRKSGLKIMSLNIFLLMPHLDELLIFVSEKKPHTLAL